MPQLGKNGSAVTREAACVDAKVKKGCLRWPGRVLKSVDALMDPGRQSRGLPDMLLEAAGAGAADALLETGSG
jgi:hypothetical protein